MSEKKQGVPGGPQGQSPWSRGQGRLKLKTFEHMSIKRRCYFSVIYSKERHATDSKLSLFGS